ncbi:hypothetical protein [Frigidibacter sp. ROC022]|uniref:hypothetical protein n=1 Tax=Frigidibacter sp. ROC022 TaxID=2971796 RepID=UPI00215B3464|nr:hypothetical protein [Frigidibacter sp. ROC022]MCR8724006.1 hypothetical protein [Frigidibacter sp. ROC022]
MQNDLCNKARNRRILALARLTRRRLRHENGAARSLPEIKSAEVGALFDTISQRLDQSPILA